ncbi:hypothetical protein F0562_012054 [Nyssa sinensis]|uniref:Uncharacterized protein n=1 Tax=Nyssa sinensis TaxID=561372 RepID=A0A5J4ZU41_9ASTE|nr:hypothetical protein F0562_012054 [Nyssa sinensis]
MAWRQKAKKLGLLSLMWLASVVVTEATAFGSGKGRRYRNAYATMMYMGTPRDYEFYVATRVMLRSLAEAQSRSRSRRHCLPRRPSPLGSSSGTGGWG